MLDRRGLSHARIAHDAKVAVNPVPATLPCVYNYQTAAGIFGKVIAFPVIESAAGKRKSAHKGGKGNDFLQDALHLGMIRKCGR